jgi:predicted metal-binding membrane protein
MPTHPAVFVAIWTLMMVAMMAPSVLPTVLLVATAPPGQEAGTSAAARTSLFVMGYFVAWAGVGTVVALGQRVIWPLAALWVRPVSAGALALAGIYQLTSWKRLCLTHCRNPLHFLLEHWRSGLAGSLLMGVHHGLYCVGCCVGLMTALVVLGMMSPLWMATIGLIVLFEKVLPMGEKLAAPVGIAMVGASIAVGLGWISTGMKPMEGM